MIIKTPSYDVQFTYKEMIALAKLVENSTVENLMEFFHLSREDATIIQGMYRELKAKVPKPNYNTSDSE